MRLLGLARIQIALLLVAAVVTVSQVTAQQPYLNETYLFAITPPSGWTINEKPSSSVVVQFELREQGVSVAALNVGVTSSEGKSLTDAVLALKQAYPTIFQDFRLISEGSVKATGIEGYAITFKFRLLGVMLQANQAIFLGNDNKLYGVTYAATETNFDKYLSEANKSIASFGFAGKLTVDAEPRVASVNVDARNYSSKDLPKTTAVVIGQTYTLSAETEASGPPGTKYVFMEWNDGIRDRSRKVTITQTQSFTAKYKTQYQLIVESEYGTVQGGGWYDSGATATFSVPSAVPVSGFMGMLGAKMVFDHWLGDATGTKESSNIKMDSPKRVTAAWRAEYTQAYVILGVIVVAIVALIAILFMKMRKTTPPSSVQIPAQPLPPSSVHTAAKYCISCGASMPTEAKHCPKCGVAQQ